MSSVSYSAATSRHQVEATNNVNLLLPTTDFHRWPVAHDC
jgi:hypothetical protein